MGKRMIWPVMDVFFLVILLLAMKTNRIGPFRAFDEEKEGLVRIHILKEEPVYSGNPAGEETAERLDEERWTWLEEEIWFAVADSLRCQETQAFSSESRPCFETDERHGTSSIKNMETGEWVSPDAELVPVLLQMEKNDLLMWSGQLFRVQEEVFVSVSLFAYSSLYYYNREEDRLAQVCHLNWAHPVGLEVISPERLKKLK